MTGNYIVIEGQDGTGKTTQVELLTEYFEKRGKKVLATREPGGDLPSTKIIRELLKNKEYSLDAISKVLLFVTNRRELWLKIIEPALKKDFVVISDRNWWSTLAFEHYGFGVSGDFIKKLHTDCMPKRYMNPDFGFIMNLDENERVKRMALRDNNQAKDAFESQNTNFQKRVSSGYRKIAAEFNIPIIDAAGTPDEIHKTITAIVESCA